MIKIGILGSTRGTNLLHIIDAINNRTLAATIEVVLSNKAESLILERAKVLGLRTEYLSTQGLSRDEYDRQISELLDRYQVDLVVLIGYMRILSADFVNYWHNKVINVHPSLLPAFAGKMDLDVHQAVLDEGAQETGCTIHFVTSEVDAGPVIVQKKCLVMPDDNAESLKARVQSLEGVALVEAIQYLST